MRRSTHLPLAFGTGGGARPAVDVVRARLGGRAEPSDDDGRVVRAALDGGVSLHGVVVAAEGELRHVLVDASTVRRVPRDALGAPRDDEATRLATLARAVQAFAALTEGTAVRYRDDAGVARDGTLVERCRFGAIVLREGDGALVGVGFRRVEARPFDA